MKLKNLLVAAVLLQLPLCLSGAEIQYSHTGQIAPSASIVASETGLFGAYFVGSTAGWDEMLGLFVNGQQVGTWGLENHLSKPGDFHLFGPVTAGDVFTFGIHVFNTDMDIYSDRELNSDLLNHVFVTDYAGNDTVPAGTFISFEDQLQSQASDFNYNDLAFVVTNVTAQVTMVPEPTIPALLGVGLLGIIGIGRSRKRASRNR